MLLFRLKVTSRKLIIFLFASMVIRSPLRLKIRQISFFVFSVYIIYIYIYKPHNDVNGVKYHQTQNSSLHSVTIITLMTSVSFDHPFSLDENH